MERFRIDKWCGYWRVGPYPYNVLKDTHEEAVQYVEDEMDRMAKQPLIADRFSVLENVGKEPSARVPHFEDEDE